MRGVATFYFGHTLLASLFFSRWLMADTQLVFTGIIKQSTCEFTVKDVELPTVDVRDFAGAGTTLGKTPFSITLSHCQSTSIAEVKMTGKSAQGEQDYFANIARQASGVAIKVTTADERHEVQKATGNLIEWQIDGVASTLDYIAEYAQITPTVLPGVVKAVAQVNVTYR